MDKLLLATAISFASLDAFAATIWNMATPYSEADFHTKNIKQFAEDVKTQTNGDIEIIVHPDASLYKEPEIFEAVRLNQVEIGELMISSMESKNPLFQLDSLPFLATDYDQAQKLWKSSSEQVKAALEEEGVILLYTTPWPGQNFYSKEPIESVDFFSGKKLHTYNAITSFMTSELNALPTTIEDLDIAHAFSTGQVDAIITSSLTGTSSQVWNHVSDYTQVNAWLPKNMIFVNKRTWQRLDDDTKNAILSAAAAAEKRGWEMSKQTNAENEQILADNGITVSPASNTLKEGLLEIRQTIVDEWLKEIGEEGQQILDVYNQ